MAKTGNHGIIIPRNKRLLTRLYWAEEMTLPEIGRLYGVNHKSVLSAMREVGVPTRPRSNAKRNRKCIICGQPTFKIKHAINGAAYGRRCRKHWNEHRNKLQREYIATNAAAKTMRDAYMRQWNIEGNKNPKGETQWISKSRHLLRTAKRLLGLTASRTASRFPNAASAPARTSRA